MRFWEKKARGAWEISSKNAFAIRGSQGDEMVRNRNGGRKGMGRGQQTGQLLRLEEMS